MTPEPFPWDLLPNDGEEAMAYLVWCVDCPCGDMTTYGENEHPDACEACGRPVLEGTK